MASVLCWASVILILFPRFGIRTGYNDVRKAILLLLLIIETAIILLYSATNKNRVWIRLFLLVRHRLTFCVQLLDCLRCRRFLTVIICCCHRIRILRTTYYLWLWHLSLFFVFHLNPLAECGIRNFLLLNIRLPVVLNFNLLVKGGASKASCSWTVLAND